MPNERLRTRKGRGTVVKNLTKRASEDLRVELRREQAAQHRLKGKSVREIAKLLGTTKSTVQNDIAIIYNRTQESGEAAIMLERQMSLERLDLLLAGVIDRAAAADLEAIDRVLRIDTRRARLLGLDAPAKMEHNTAPGVSAMLDKVAEAVARKRQREGSA